VLAAAANYRNGVLYLGVLPSRLIDLAQQVDYDDLHDSLVRARTRLRRFGRSR